MLLAWSLRSGLFPETEAPYVEEPEAPEMPLHGDGGKNREGCIPNDPGYFY